MQLAMAEAYEAFDRGEVPVGAVIVNRAENLVVASSRNSMQSAQNPNAHAEILVINEACSKLCNKNLSQCDIYITLEPCTMCVSAISNARLARVYYAAPDEKQGAVENGVRFFTSASCLHRPEIYSGLYQEESINLMKNFFTKLRQNK